MTGKKQDAAKFIPPNAYPQMLAKRDAAQALKALQSAQTAAKAAVAMQACLAPMREAVLAYVGELERAGSDMTKVFESAHEIRGIAETGGLITVGRLSENLCHYMDAMDRMGRTPDPAVVALHVSAVVRAAKSGEDGMGAVVTAELSALVARKLGGLKAGQP
ncbi:MAG TPA: hypothetical protein VHC40_07070 [Rhizomicrobium sp.]|nr:hypothetical protein [Rhizomicrobium sp.]